MTICGGHWPIWATAMCGHKFLGYTPKPNLFWPDFIELLVLSSILLSIQQKKIDKIYFSKKYYGDWDDTRDTNPSLDILESLKSSSTENSSVSNIAEYIIYYFDISQFIWRQFCSRCIWYAFTYIYPLPKSCSTDIYRRLTPPSNLLHCIKLTKVLGHWGQI